ncbi:P-loop containing nucleoside triphosphate hydrolase protein [Abortiporus biennis]|nr:P-loop containing nucleoside triphosphate hydrolase protein [Abortiporus biennis]
MSSEPLLEVKQVGCNKAKGQPIFADVNFDVREGDIVILQGKSGAGKSTLLKCLAHLNLYDGEIAFRGRTPKSYGIPLFRTHVLYVPQRPSLLPGTPRDFLNTVVKFKAHSEKAHQKAGDLVPSSVDLNEPIKLAELWGIDKELWDRLWTDLSGGEAQRVALAIGVGLKSAEILLLDEPTSALDLQSSEKVEKYLVDAVRKKEGGLKAIVWITHSEEQGRRVGSRFLRIENGTLQEERVDSGV